MSHNKITVDNNSPSSSGDIPVNLSSYIEETSPDVGELIKYDGAYWINSVTPSKIDMNAGMGLILRNGVSFAGSGNYTVGDYLMIARTGSRIYSFLESGYALNPATATNTIRSNSNWLESVAIPSAGTYLCICTLSISTGDMQARWESNSGGFSNYVHVFHNNNTASGSILLGILTTTGTDTVRVVTISKHGKHTHQ